MHDQRKACRAHWRVPVYVRIGHGASDAMTGAEEALDYLNLRWPTERGRKYVAACIACANAVEQRESPEVAREAFIAAAIEAVVIA